MQYIATIWKCKYFHSLKMTTHTHIHTQTYIHNSPLNNMGLELPGSSYMWIFFPHGGWLKPPMGKESQIGRPTVKLHSAFWLHGNLAPVSSPPAPVCSRVNCIYLSQVSDCLLASNPASKKMFRTGSCQTIFCSWRNLWYPHFDVWQFPGIEISFSLFSETVIEEQNREQL